LEKLKFKDPKEYHDYWAKLVELEREAEKEFHLQEIASISGKEREKRGRALVGLKAKLVGTLIGDFLLYRFYKEHMPQHQINVSDQVLISKDNPLKWSIEGTVYEKGKNYLTVAVGQKLPKWKSYRLDLFVNDITFKRMLSTLDIFEKGQVEVDRDIILGKGKPKVCTEKLEFFNKNLNHSQQEAVQRAVCSPELFLIHGPPGTGKTTTLVEIILQLINKGKKILATADSNTAVDNLLERVIKHNIETVRIGHPVRIKRELLEVSLDSKVENHPDYKKVKKIDNKIQALKEKQEDYLKPIPQRRRGLTDEEILRYAQEGKKVRGHKIETIKKMAEWVKIQHQINELLQEKRALEEQIVKDIIQNAKVVFATNSGSGSEFLQDFKFDVVVVDEASQSTEPSSLIPVVKGKKFILAGDHKQLPPTILNPEAKGLEFTMFERLIKLYPENSHMLQIQYRMNEVIKNFPSQLFYNGQLISDEKVKDIKLSDIAQIQEGNPILDDTPIVFIDTGGRFLEKQKRDSKSKYNPEEAKLVKYIVERLKEAGVSPSDIGVITPYKEHEEYLKKLLPDVEVKTVDGFQGREKEVIVISLVRSNPDEEIGFLQDLRRLNVAITRGKRKLIMVGDSKTLSSNPVYKKLIQYIQNHGKVVKIED